MLKAGLAIQTEGPGGTGPHGTKVVHPPPTPAEIASLFPQLEILECLGRGGMGVVYKARQPRLNRLVALKILARDKEQDARFTERFTREAQALARLNHPNIVTVHDFGEAGGHCYLVMEFVDGLNLRQLLQTGKMKPEQALTIVPKICEALQYAHEQGIVHRDIKPENILLDKSGRVKIADFGIAKILGDEAGQQTLTGAKDAVGTPHYMAPEQIEKPQTVDHRADIYSLGVVFYEMLTGELPLGKFQPPSKKVQVDVRLDEVVLHALEKDPERRYQHASEVKTQVETIVATSTGDRSPKVDESVRRALRTPARGLIAAGVLQLLFSLGLLAFGIVVAREDGDVVAYAGIGFVAVLFMAFAAIVLRGAAGMMKLRNYPFSVVTSVVAAVTGPGALLGLPFGVWALVELIRPEVRAAFAANRPPSGSNATLAPGKMDFARSQVKGPAIGLVVTGVLDWVLMALVCIIVGLKSAGGLPIWLPFLAMALSSCIIYAGLKFMQLERRGVVIFGSVLALLVSPGNLIGLPLGIWALVALNRREVREAFEANRQRADKTNLSVPPTAQRADHFWRFIVIVFLVIPTLGLLSSIALKNYIKTGGNPQPPIKYDYIGQAWFPQGDSIAITSVERTEKQMTVKGHYNLVSHDSATLALYVTSTNQSGFSEDAQQSMQISKGPGDFELSDFHLVPGLPHVSMYADGKPFAGLYFGTKAEALEESKASWITNVSSASTLQFRLVLPSDSTEPADDLPSVLGHNQFHLSRHTLLDDADIAKAGSDFGPDGRRKIEIRFTEAGAKKFEAITSTNIGHQLAIVFRGQVLSAPVIQTVIPGGELQVDGLMTAGEINEIVDRLNHTATPTAEAWGFSAVFERILPFEPQPNALFGWLDLDSGMVLTNSVLDWQSRAGHDWISNNGLDVVTTESAKHYATLLGFDMIIAPAPTNGWGIVTPADVIHNWAFLQNEPRQMEVFGAIPGQSDTYFFQTREGGKGFCKFLVLLITRPA